MSIKVDYDLARLNRAHLDMFEKISERYAQENGRPNRAMIKAMRNEGWRRNAEAARLATERLAGPGVPLEPLQLEIPEMEPRYLADYLQQLYSLGVNMFLVNLRAKTDPSFLKTAEDFLAAIVAPCEERLCHLDPAVARSLRPGLPPASQRPN